MAFSRDARAGVAPPTLAHIYGRPIGTVYRWLKRLGIKEAPPAKGGAATAQNDKFGSSPESTPNAVGNGAREEE